MPPPKINGPASSSPEHSKTDEAEENDLKNNPVKMIEAHKEEIKKSL